ncbi:MAG: NADH-quinone oxidoreductase subunit NuoN [Magnetococcales bacterium]|nr:NADH-quinone oxidoreductase subunit NuoN [Magnetococcales bacterium]
MPVQMPDINLGLMLPELLITLLAMVLLLMSAWYGKEGRGTIGWMSIFGIGLAALAILSGGGSGETTFGGMFIDDSFARFMKLLICIATALPLIISMNYIRDHRLDGGEYFVITLFALLGGLFMVSSGGFVMLYLGLELMSLSIYILAAVRRQDVKSSEAGLKYFVLGSLASGILLYGISLIYGTLGTLSYTGVAEALAESHGHVSPVVGLGLVLIIGGLSFKVAAAPFHMWAPDVYEGAPTSVTAFMAVMPKVAAFAVLYRVLAGAFPALHDQWGPLLQFLAVLSMAVGSLAAIAQTNIKRMLAYSSIGHVGFLLIGLSTGTIDGYQSVLIYLTIYIFMSIGAFGLILLLNREGIGENIEDFKGLSRKRPYLAVLMSIFMFSMAGIPPLAGFVGKLYIFMAAIKAGLLTVAILGVIFSAIGAFYYLRVVKYMYFDEAESEFAMTVNSTSQAVIIISGIVIVVWGILPSALLSWTEATMRLFH